MTLFKHFLFEEEQTFSTFFDANKKDIEAEFDKISSSTQFVKNKLLHNLVVFFINNENELKSNKNDKPENFIKNNTKILKNIFNSTDEQDNNEDLLDSKLLQVVSKWFLIYKLQK